MHINISGLRFWDGHHCYGLTQATVAVISKPTVFPPSTMCSSLSPSGEWIDCKVICWLRGRAPHSVTLQFKWFYGFWVCAKVKTSSLCILGHTRFSYVTLFHSARFYSTGHQELNMPSRLWLSSFLGIGIPQSFILYPPDRVGCVAVTNGPTIYLSGLLYKEIFFFLHSLTQSSWATAQLTGQVFERRENKHGESHTEFQGSYSDVTYLFPVTFPQYGQSRGQVCHQ